ncbi:serine hydrolase [Candidatus Parcubacteria bacterium]|nr:MAG: serine hydrolase [Candidatus Parcubacteria bacterium]
METRRSRKKKRIIKIFVFNLILFTVFSILIIKLIIQPASPPAIINPLIPDLPSIFQETNNSKSNSLENAVQSALSESTGTYGVVIKNLNTDEKYYLNEHRVFKTASLYKLWIMAVAYEQIQTGKLQKDQILTEDVSSLNDKFQIASESAEKTEGTITLSVTEALNKMITISDNYSALLLSAQVKLSNVALFLKNQNLTESNIGTEDKSYPTTTPSDIALFFEKLYKGELANEKYTKEMIDLLKNQRLNNKLPKYLPQNTIIAHKTGELYNITHDAGIVYTPTENYIIVVLSETDNPEKAVEIIGQISKNVYNYFTTKQK